MYPNRLYRCILLLCFFLLTGTIRSETVIAQHSDNAFKTFEIGLTGNIDVSRNLFHDFWMQNKGMGIHFKTPFYFGYVEALGEYYSYRGIGEGTIDGRAPDFINIILAAGWGQKVRVSSSLELYGGFFVGNSLLNFEQHSFLGKGESEIIAGLNLNVRYHVSDNWLIRVGARQTRMFTYHRINLSHISFGLNRKLKSPVWLQNFFK